MSRSDSVPKMYQHRPGYCSFCRKSYKEAGSLAEGPDEVYICYHCVIACKNLIEEERRRRNIQPGDPPVSPVARNRPAAP